MNNIMLTVECAKEIAMTTKNESGQLCRDYFLIMLDAYKRNKIKMGCDKVFKVEGMSKRKVEKQIFNSNEVRKELIEIDLIIKKYMEVA